MFPNSCWIWTKNRARYESVIETFLKLNLKESRTKLQTYLNIGSNKGILWKTCCLYFFCIHRWVQQLHIISPSIPKFDYFTFTNLILLPHIFYFWDPLHFIPGSDTNADSSSSVSFVCWLPIIIKTAKIYFSKYLILFGWASTNDTQIQLCSSSITNNSLYMVITKVPPSFESKFMTII